MVLFSFRCMVHSVTHIHACILSQTLFPFRSLWSIGQSSLCHTVGAGLLPILAINRVYTSVPNKMAE